VEGIPPTWGDVGIIGDRKLKNWASLRGGEEIGDGGGTNSAGGGRSLLMVSQPPPKRKISPGHR